MSKFLSFCREKRVYFQKSYLILLWYLFWGFRLDTQKNFQLIFQTAYLEFSKINFFSVIILSVILIAFFINFIWACLKGDWVKKTHAILSVVFMLAMYYYFTHLPEPIINENGQEKVLCDEIKAVNVNVELCKQCSNRNFKNGKCLLSDTSNKIH